MVSKWVPCQRQSLIVLHYHRLNVYFLGWIYLCSTNIKHALEYSRIISLTCERISNGVCIFTNVTSSAYMMLLAWILIPMSLITTMIRRGPRTKPLVPYLKIYFNGISALNCYYVFTVLQRRLGSPTPNKLNLERRIAYLYIVYNQILHLSQMKLFFAFLPVSHSSWTNSIQLLTSYTVFFPVRKPYW